MISRAIRSVVAARRMVAPSVLVLSLGIGLLTAHLAVLDATSWNALPFQNAAQLVEVRGVSYELLNELPRGEIFEAVSTSFSTKLAARVADGQMRRLNVAAVSPSYFTVFATSPIAGRLFSPEDATAKTGTVVILSEGFWRDQFARDPKAIGSALLVNGQPMIIVGVVPRRAGIMLDPDLWLPTWSGTSASIPFRIEMTGGVGFRGGIVALLRKDISLREATERLQALETAFETNRNLGASKVTIRSLRIALTGNTTAAFRLAIVSSLILFVSLCTTAGALSINRAVASHRAVSVRLALGASVAQAVAPVISELVVLFSIATLLGAATSTLILPMMAQFIPPMLYGYFPSWRLIPLALTVGVAVLVVGSAPAAIELFGTGALGSIRSNLSATSKRQYRWQAIIGIWQVASVTVVLTLAGSLLDTARILHSVDPGAAMSSTAMEIALPEWKGQSVLLDLVRSIPTALQAQGIDGIAVTDFLPFGPSLGSQQAVSCPRGPVPALVRRTSGRLTAAMGLSILTSTNTNSLAEEDAFVSAAFNRTCWGDGPNEARTVTIDGVPRNVSATLVDTRDRGPANPSTPAIYVGFEQPNGRSIPSVVYLIMNAEESSKLAMIRQTIRAADSDISIGLTTSLGQLERATFTLERSRALLASTMALSLIVIMLLSLAGMMAYRVRSQAKPIAIRVALGASPLAVRRWLLRDLYRVASIGVVVGAAASLACAQILRAVLVDAGVGSAGIVGASVAVSWSLPVVLCSILLGSQLQWTNVIAPLREQ